MIRWPLLHFELVMFELAVFHFESTAIRVHFSSYKKIVRNYHFRFLMGFFRIFSLRKKLSNLLDEHFDLVSENLSSLIIIHLLIHNVQANSND